MRRAAFAGLLAALAFAAPAAAADKIPEVRGGSVIGKNLPLKVFASISPPVHLFGDSITAKVAVVADRRWVAPANLRAVVHFHPYEPIGPPTEVRTGGGRLLQVTWTWTLRCLTPDCIPVMRHSQFTHVFRFSPAHVEYLSPAGAVRYAVDARFQPVEVLSQLSPSVINAVGLHTIEWQAPLTPLARPHYRVSPDLAFWLAVGLAIALGTAGLGLATRWAWQFRPRAASVASLPASSLERALTLFFWARAQNDETLQRKALERVADELPFDVHELSETARALAWSREAPEEEDVQVISERAGIRRRNGEPEL